MTKKHKKNKISPPKPVQGGEMGYKRWNQNISFVDIALSSSMEKNRSLKTMDRINRVIDWTKVEERLRDYYEIGRQEEGADAYPPLMLLKALLLQKWFHIPSDPELENQILPREIIPTEIYPCIAHKKIEIPKEIISPYFTGRVTGGLLRNF